MIFLDSDFPSACLIWEIFFPVERLIWACCLPSEIKISLLFNLSASASYCMETLISGGGSIFKISYLRQCNPHSLQAI